MKLLYTFDSQDYESLTKHSFRQAVRAIIERDGKLAMVFSEKEGYYKFPGGGIEENESHAQALLRETAEETGLQIVPASLRAFGKIREIRKSTLFADEVFEHISYYYFAETAREASRQRLEPYEEELGYRLAFVDIGEAYEANLEKSGRYTSSFILREAKVLELLLRERSGNKET